MPSKKNYNTEVLDKLRVIDQEHGSNCSMDLLAKLSSPSPRESSNIYVDPEIYYYTSPTNKDMFGDPEIYHYTYFYTYTYTYTSNKNTENKK